MTDPSDRGPGVPIPPPILVGGLALLGYVLHRVDPLPLGFAFELPGAAVVALAAGLVAWALVTMARARTSVRPDRPDQALVEHGPFRHSRNPIYLGMLFAVLGLALILGDLWAWLTVFATFSALQRFVVAREEAYLQHRFGAAYAAYSARVNRWI